MRVDGGGKGNAYGHGDVEVSEYLNRLGIQAFAVATIDEGIRLRRRGVQGTILVLGYTAPKRAAELFHFDLSQTVVTAEHAKRLSRFGKPLRVHVKVDTGMHRLGENCSHAAEIARIFHCKNLQAEGIFTHLCASDSLEAEDAAFTKAQIQGFQQLLQQIREMQISLPKVHIQSSYGLLNYPELQCDYAQIGIALYGVLSQPGAKTKLSLDLRPVLALKSKVALIRTIEAGANVGCGRKFIAPRRTTITVVTLIGRDGAEEITAEQVAKNAGTITNELLSRLGGRLERVHVW